MGIFNGPLSLEVSNLSSISILSKNTITAKKKDALLAHVMIIGLGLIVQTAGIVDRDGVALFGEILAVAWFEGLFCDAHD